MLPLLKKEWMFMKPLVLRLVFLGLPVFLVVFFLTGGASTGGLVSGITSGVSLMLVFGFVFNACYREEKAGGISFLRSLPISCTQITGAKFLVLACLCAAALLVSFAVLFLYELLGVLPPGGWGNFWSAGLSSFSTVIVMGGIMLWSFFRFGYDKMGLSMLVSFLVLPALITVMGLLILKVFLGLSLQVTEQQLIFILLPAALVLFVLCWLGSVRALQARDL